MKNTWGTLSSFWNWTSKEFSLDNPFNLSPVKAYTKPILPLTLEEIEKLLKACEYSSKKAEGRKPYNSKRPTVKRDSWRYLTERFHDNKPHENEPLFVDSQFIHRITRQGVLLLVKRLGEKAGVADVHPHKFRHTFAVQFLRNGGNVFELQNMLGHTDLDMVKNYVKLAQLDLELVARKASPVDNWRLR